MSAEQKRGARHRLSDAALSDLRNVFDTVGIDSTEFSNDDLNNIGMMLLTIDKIHLSLRRRRMHSSQENAIIDT